VLQQSLKVAVKNKYILSSPATDLKVPTSENKKVIPLTDKELTKLLSDRKNTRNYLYYVLSVYTGARIGEVLGLSWDDIDLKNNIIHIRHSLKVSKNTNGDEIISATARKTIHVLGSTKTGKTRDVPLLPIVVNVIKQHKIKQIEEKLQIGQSYNSNNMVFCDVVGEYLKIKYMYDELKKAVKRLNIGTDVTPHTLRHTFVSQMISAGTTSIALISSIVGHTDIITTLKTYSHLMPNDMEEAFKALDKHMENIVI